MINAIFFLADLTYLEIIILQRVLYPLNVSEFEVSVKSFANIFISRLHSLNFKNKTFKTNILLFSYYIVLKGFQLTVERQQHIASYSIASFTSLNTTRPPETTNSEVGFSQTTQKKGKSYFRQPITKYASRKSLSINTLKFWATKNEITLLNFKMVRTNIR